jgi:hypothetical protein
MLAVLASNAVAATAEEKPREIPLKEVWGYRMPGTKPMEPVAGHEDAAADPDLIAHIRKALPYLDKKKPGKGFAVLSENALEQAHDVLVKREKARKSFPTDTEISAVFFAHELGSYVHLHRVERRDDSVEIQYRYVPHETKEMTNHLAIIPLGKFSPGTVNVEVTQVNAKEKRTGVRGKSVSQSFSYVVK